MSAYLALLRDPRWQKKRLEILNRDEFACQGCFDSESTLHVHHKVYQRGCNPWEYDAADLVTLCESCHGVETERLAASKSRLLRALGRWGFFSAQFDEFAEALEAAPPLHASEPTASMLAFAVTDSECREVIDRLFWADTRTRAERLRQAGAIDG